MLQCPRCMARNVQRARTPPVGPHNWFCLMCGFRFHFVLSRSVPAPGFEPPDTRLEPWLRHFPQIGGRRNADD